MDRPGPRDDSPIATARCSEKTDKYETIYLDGERMYRALAAFTEAIRPPGATDLEIRLQDLDREGVRYQLAFPVDGILAGQPQGSGSADRS